MTNADRKRIADAIIDLLPNDPTEAIITVALAMANVVVCTGCPDEGGLAALGAAIKQMRASDHWKDG